MESRPTRNIFITRSVLSRIACTLLLLCGSALTVAYSAPGDSERGYFRISQSKESEKHDLDIVSLGSLSVRADRIAHFDLTRIKSLQHGDAWSINFGAGYHYQSLYLSLGVALGRNTDTDDNQFAYYPEAGLILDLTSELAATISIKRYHRLYREDDSVVMVGILIRQ